MNDRRAHSVVSPALATAVLVLFSLAGLIGGVVTHGLVSTHSGTSPAHAATTTTPRATGAPHRTPTTGVTLNSPPASNGHFSLALTFAPSTARAGGSLTITVSATLNGTSLPDARLVCTLSAPGSGAALLSQWPAPIATNAQGIATWQVTVPNLPSGQYGVKVSASNPDKYADFQISWIQVTS